MGGLTGVRSMTQPTSQRQQPRYNQRVPRNPQANAGQRTAGSGARRSDQGVEHRSTEHPAWSSGLPRRLLGEWV